MLRSRSLPKPFCFVPSPIPFWQSSSDLTRSTLSFTSSLHRSPAPISSSSSSSSSSSVETLENPSSAFSLSRGQFRVDVLSESLPFIQKFRGKTIVVKYGGAAMKSQALQASVINDLVLLSCVGLRPVLVHGGGPEINHWLKRLNIEVLFRDGLRVTDADTMKIVSMVLVGDVNKHLVSLINKAGASAAGLCGVDGRLLTARPAPNAAQLGFVGEVARVDPTVLHALIDKGHIPVVSSVAADETGQMYNINADTVAGELAAALGAEKLILLTDVAGILEDKDDPNTLLKEVDIKGVKRLMEEGKIAGGMIPKVKCCLRSLAQGVKTASIIDGRLPHSLLLEIMTDQGAGTMITGELCYDYFQSTRCLPHLAEMVELVKMMKGEVICQVRITDIAYIGMMLPQRPLLDEALREDSSYPCLSFQHRPLHNF